MKKENETRITVRFPSPIVEALKTFLEEDDRSLNSEIVQAVREYVARKRKGRKPQSHEDF